MAQSGDDLRVALPALGAGGDQQTRQDTGSFLCGLLLIGMAARRIAAAALQLLNDGVQPGGNGGQVRLSSEMQTAQLITQPALKRGRVAIEPREPRIILIPRQGGVQLGSAVGGQQLIRLAACRQVPNTVCIPCKGTLVIRTVALIKNSGLHETGSAVCVHQGDIVIGTVGIERHLIRRAVMPHDMGGRDRQILRQQLHIARVNGQGRGGRQVEIGEGIEVLTVMLREGAGIHLQKLPIRRGKAAKEAILQ